jgi:hypothetical protein
MIKKLLPLLFLFAGFQANAAIVKTFDLSGFIGAGVNPATFDDLLVTISFADDVDFNAVIGADLNTMTFNLGFEQITSNVLNYSGMIDHFFSESGGIVSLTIGGTTSPRGKFSGFGISLGYGYNNGHINLSSAACSACGNSVENSLYGAASFTVSEVAVPEPPVIALFAAGLFGIGFARRRQL